MVIDKFIFKNNQIMLFPCVTSIPKTGVGQPKTGVGQPKTGVSNYCGVMTLLGGGLCRKEESKPESFGWCILNPFNKMKGYMKV